MKIIERNESGYVLEPLKQYLEGEGIKADVQIEWKVGKKHGPYVLVVDDDLYDEAIKALDNIDKSGIDDGIPLTTKSGKTTEQVKARNDIVARWVVRVFLILIIAYFVYLTLWC